VVGADESGSLIIPLLKAGIPQTPKLSPMPQFSDLSQGELAAIVRWIHYARQQERYKEVAASLPSVRADAAAGKARFETECSGCHAPAGNLAPALRGATRQALELKLMRPAFLEATAPREEGKAARVRHLALLENATAQGVADIAAWLAGSSR
jgi:mono/diheme cytochrome c family protein